METKGIIITSKRQFGQWTATATLNGEFAGSCTSKSKKYAETEARKDAETYQRNQPRTAAPTPEPVTAQRLAPYSLHQFDQVSLLSLIKSAA